MTSMTAAQLRARTGGMEQAPNPEVPERPRPPRLPEAAWINKPLDPSKPPQQLPY